MSVEEAARAMATALRDIRDNFDCVVGEGGAAQHQCPECIARAALAAWEAAQPVGLLDQLHAEVLGPLGHIYHPCTAPVDDPAYCEAHRHCHFEDIEGTYCGQPRSAHTPDPQRKASESA